MSIDRKGYSKSPKLKTMALLSVQEQNYNLSDCFENIWLMTCDNQKHVQRIEMGQRELKDCICSTRMVMKYKKIPKHLAFEIMKEVTKLINSLPKKGGVHSMQFPWLLVIGVPLCTTINICGQYAQGHIVSPNETCIKRTINLLYIGRNDNGSL